MDAEDASSSPAPSDESQGSDTENCLLRLVEALFWREAEVPSLLDVDADVGLGCNYPCEQKDLARLQPLAGMYPRPFPTACSFQDAFDQLWNNLGKDLDAVDNYNNHFWNIRDSVKQTWDLPAKMFKDLDAMLFHGQLHGRVVLRWEATSIAHPGLLGYTVAVPWLGPSTPGFIKISLRYNMDWSCYPRHLMIGVLVHEMLHAYFIIMCGTGLETSTLRDAAHGDIWMSAAIVLSQYTKLDLCALRHPVPFGRGDAWRTQRTWWFVLEFLGIENRALLQTHFAQLLVSERYVQTSGGVYMPLGPVY